MTRIFSALSLKWVVFPPTMLAVILVISGCIPVPMPGPYIEPVDAPLAAQSASRQTVSRAINNIAIGGVTSALSPLTMEQRSRLSDELYSALYSEHPGKTFLTHYDIETLIGSGLHQQILDGYQLTADLSDAHWAPLRRVGADFAVFARLERDTLRYTSGEPEIASTALNDQYGKLTGRVRLNTRRTITVSLSLYDLQSQRLVWKSEAGATRTHSDVYQYSYTGNAADSTSLRAKLQTDLENKNRTIYPSPETLDALMLRVFANFARQLPEAG